MNVGFVTAADVLSAGPQKHAPTPSFATLWLVKSTGAGGREHALLGSEGACE